MAVAFAAHVAGCALLIPLYGGMGAALSLLIALSLVNLLRLSTAAKLFGFFVLDRHFLKPVAAVLLALVGGLFATYWTLGLDPNWVAAVQIATIVLVYLAALRLLGISAEGRALVASLKQRREASGENNRVS